MNKWKFRFCAGRGTSRASLDSTGEDCPHGVSHKTRLPKRPLLGKFAKLAYTPLATSQVAAYRHFRAMVTSVTLCCYISGIQFSE